MSSLPSEEFFALRRPCGNCPFRNDIQFPLGRAQDIADGLRRGVPFVCHKTVDYNHDDVDDRQEKARMCAGARATAAKDGIVVTSEQVASRLGLPVPGLDDDLPVFDSLADWVAAKAAG